ncbi:MAG TPA: hypothetical protein PLZ36_14080 [Armatimonadota bacterium]|nr:hypothetical protein [Armatimonadota bacterium]
MNQRDHSLDFLKGIGCMLMVFSHSYVVGHTLPLFLLAAAGAFLGRLAPILFFSVSGVVNALQAKRRPLRYFAVFAGLFALLGLIYNAYWRPDFGTGIESDIPQIVAMTILATVIVEKTFRNPTLGYALVAGVLAVLHFVVGPFVPAFPGRQFLFVPLDGPGVFPLTPWLIFPMLGNIAYRLEDTTIRRIASGLAGILVAALVGSYFLLPRAVYGPFWTDKYAMTLGYFALSVTLLYVIYAFMRGAGARLIHPLVTYIGRNSFPFMFIHLIWIRLFKYLDVTNPLMVWPAVLVLTVPTVMLFDRLQKGRVEKLFLSPIAWVIYAVALAVQLIYIRDFSLLLYLLGLVFAYEYRPLAQALKAFFTPKPPEQAPAPHQPASA